VLTTDQAVAEIRANKLRAVIHGEVCAIYWLIKPAALRDRRFDDVEISHGPRSASRHLIAAGRGGWRLQRHSKPRCCAAAAREIPDVGELRYREAVTQSVAVSSFASNRSWMLITGAQRMSPTIGSGCSTGRTFA